MSRSLAAHVGAGSQGLLVFGWTGVVSWILLLEMHSRLIQTFEGEFHIWPIF